MRKRRNWAWEIAFVGLALAVGVGFSLKPWRAYNEQRKVRDELVNDMRAAETRSEELIRQKAKTESALGREEMARKHGFQRPNETPIDVD